LLDDVPVGRTVDECAHHRPDIGSIADYLPSRRTGTEQWREVAVNQALATGDAVGSGLSETVDRPVND
jgi:hypothetical protein